MKILNLIVILLLLLPLTLHSQTHSTSHRITLTGGDIEEEITTTIHITSTTLTLSTPAGVWYTGKVLKEDRGGIVLSCGGWCRVDYNCWGEFVGMFFNYKNYKYYLYNNQKV